MALVLKDRVRETSISVGTSAISLLGAVTGYQTFGASVGSGNTCYYTIYNQGTNEWEVGLGTVGSGTLSRDTVLSSSNSNALVDFTAGTKDVFVTYPSEKAVYLNDSGAITPTALTVTSLTDSGLTSGRVTYASTGGLLIDSANLTFNGTTLTSTGFSGPLNGTVGATTPAAGTFTNLAYTGTLTGGTGVINIGSGQVYKDASGNVGIGTSSPGFRFVISQTNLETGSIPLASFGVSRQLFIQPGLGGNDVYNSGIGFSAYFDTAAATPQFILPAGRNTDGGAGISSSNVGDIDFYTYNAGNQNAATVNLSTARKMRITTAGNVGIGTVSPSYKLDVAGQIASQDAYLITANSSGTPSAGAFIFRPASNTIALGTASAERMRIDSSGNVGIGTSSVESGFRLHVTGNGFFSPSSGTVGKVVVDNVDQRLVLGSYFDPGVGQYSFISSTNNAETGNLPLLFNTGTTERMRIDSSGNVGIGTSSLTDKLEVVGATTAGDRVVASFWQADTTANSSSSIWLSSVTGGNSGGARGTKISAITNGNGAGNGHSLAFATSANSASPTERMRITSAGNVGIGTSNPGYMLDVASTSSNQVALQYSGVGRYLLGCDSGFNLIFSKEGTGERMRIDSSGNVGIGTSSPSYKLDIRSSGGSSGIHLSNSGTNDTGAYINATGNSEVMFSGGANYNSYSAPNFVMTAKSTIASGVYCQGDAISFWVNTGLTAGTTFNQTERMRITSAGEVWIAGTTDRGAFNLQCNGTGVWGAGAYTNGSDARIKEEIEPISSSLEVVNKLNPVTFKYKEDWSSDRATQTGFIAQELQEALADEVYIDGVVNDTSEYMSVAYQNIIPILTKAIQELSAKVEALEAQLNKE
jgi:hypothetical protein